MNQSANDSPFKANDVVAQDASVLAHELSQIVANNLKEAVDTRGVATLVVSGGSTPLPFFKELASVDLDWENITIMLADERWVAPDHTDSNERFVKEQLMIGNASKAKFVGLKNGAETPEQGWAESESAMAAIQYPFDVVILGMGGDGHTASLFPATEGLQQAIAKDCGQLTWPMNPSTVEQPRMSLTLDCLLDTRHLYLHITGDSKRLIFQQAASTDPDVYPIAAVIKSAADRLRVFWAP